MFCVSTLLVSFFIFYLLHMTHVQIYMLIGGTCVHVCIVLKYICIVCVYMFYTLFFIFRCKNVFKCT